MTKAIFIDDTTIKVTARDGEVFTLKSFLPVPLKEEQELQAQVLIQYFEEEFSDDKSSMVYFVLTKTMSNNGFSFSLVGSDRSKERERIGARIRELRESKRMEAKYLAKLAKIDAANLSRIEQGKYSVGFDVLTKISQVLGVKVQLL